MAPGFDGKKFSIGVLTITAGPMAPASAPSSAGIEAYIQALNAKGGIAGKYPVELVVRDHAYDPAKSAQSYQAIKDQVAMFTWISGTPPVRAVLPSLTKDNILAIGGTTEGSLTLEEQLIPSGTPTETLLLDGVEYLLREGGSSQKVCGAAVEGAITKTVESISAYAKDKLGVTTGPVVSIGGQDANPTPAMQQLQREGCQIVMIQGIAVPFVSNVLSTAAKLGYEPKWVGVSSTWTKSLNSGPVYDYAHKNMTIVADDLLWGDTGHGNAENEKAMMAAHDKYTPKEGTDQQFSWGYNNAAITEQILTKAVETGDVSRAGLKKAEESLTKLNYPTQFDRPWGSGDKRGIPQEYSIFRPDSSGIGAVGILKYGERSSDKVLAYQFVKSS